MLKWVFKVLALVVVSAAAVELLAGAWLTRFADEDAFSRFASLSEHRERLARRGESTLKYSPHRYLGYVPSPNFNGLRFGVRHNRRGFRSPEIPDAKTPGETRILALGASTTYGLYPNAEQWKTTRELIEKLTSLDDPDSDPFVRQALESYRVESVDRLLTSLSYPGYLEARLQRRGYPRVRVINGGAEGYTSWESLLNFELRGLDVEPDIVVVYHGYNDIHSRLVWPPEAYRSDRSGQMTDSSGWYQPLPWYLRSRAIRILAVSFGWVPSPTRLDSVFARIEPTARFYPYEEQLRAGTYPAGEFVEHPVAEMLDANPPVFFRRNLESIVLAAIGRGIQPVLMTFASDRAGSGKLMDTPEYRRALAEHNQVVRSLARQHDVPLLDLAEIFPKDDALFQDTIHMTTDGGWLQAGLVADFLIDNDLLPASGDF